MKRYLILAIASFFSINCAHSADEQEPPQAESATLGQRRRLNAAEETDIKELLKNYQQALNSSDLEGAMRLYTHDSVLMAENQPTAIGIEAVKQAYADTFQAISLNIKFHIPNQTSVDAQTSRAATTRAT